MDQRYLDGLRRHPLALRAVDFVSTAARVKLGVLPPLGLMRAHEHINFFGEQSLASLSRSAGCRVLHMERTPFAPPSDRLPVVTGGTGSFGRAFIKALLARYPAIRQ